MFLKIKEINMISTVNHVNHVLSLQCVKYSIYVGGPFEIQNGYHA